MVLVAVPIVETADVSFGPELRARPSGTGRQSLPRRYLRQRYLSQRYLPRRGGIPLDQT
jgi:hypothetical protein